MIGLFLVDADLVDAVAVPVADDGIVAGVAEVLVQIAVVEQAVVVDVDLPVAVAIDAQFVDAVTVEVAHHRLVAPFAKLERRTLFDRKRKNKTPIRGYPSELTDRKLVLNHSRLGYYRPDRPPPELK